MINFQKLGEDLNECVNEKLIIRIGRYEGDYYLGNDEFKRITGEIFLKTNSDTIFRVVSDDSTIVDEFDIIGSDVKITPINKKLENSIIGKNRVDISNKKLLRAYFPNDKEGTEMFECVQSIPIRFREEALDIFNFKEDREMWNMKTIDKAWSYYLEEILQEMTNKERERYNF